MFGTFRDKLKESGTTYRGDFKEKVDAKSAAIHDSKATLNGLPDLGFFIYMVINCFIWILLGFAIMQKVQYLHCSILRHQNFYSPKYLIKILLECSFSNC